MTLFYTITISYSRSVPLYLELRLNLVVRTVICNWDFIFLSVVVLYLTLLHCLFYHEMWFKSCVYEFVSLWLYIYFILIIAYVFHNCGNISCNVTYQLVVKPSYTITLMCTVNTANNTIMHNGYCEKSGHLSQT